MSDVTAVNANDEANVIAFLKIATMAAVHIQAMNTAIESGDMELLKSSLDFGKKVSDGVLSQIPDEVMMEVMMDVLASSLGL